MRQAVSGFNFQIPHTRAQSESDENAGAPQLAAALAAAAAATARAVAAERAAAAEAARLEAVEAELAGLGGLTLSDEGPLSLARPVVEQPAAQLAAVHAAVSGVTLEGASGEGTLSLRLGATHRLALRLEAGLVVEAEVQPRDVGLSDLLGLPPPVVLREARARLAAGGFAA